MWILQLRIRVRIRDLRQREHHELVSRRAVG
jgi:hypothetical protein